MARGTPKIHFWKPLDRVMRPDACARWLVQGVAIVIVASLLGCSGRGTYITGRPSAGQLKSSLSHVEYENEQLRTQLARLKDEHRQAEDRLDQEKLHNDELLTKLDDARNRLRDDGYDFGTDLDAPLGRPQTLPAGRTSPSRRKSPAAQISHSNEMDEIPPIQINDDPPRSKRTRPSRPSSRKIDDDDSISMMERDLNWIPIARGSDETEPSPKR